MISEENLYKLPSKFKLDIKKTSHAYLTRKLIKSIYCLLKIIIQVKKVSSKDVKWSGQQIK